MPLHNNDESTFSLLFYTLADERLQRVQLFLEQETATDGRSVIDLDEFLRRLREALLPFHYTNPLTDLRVAWGIVHRNKSVCIILGGTSGCGKSTLASLLARRYVSSGGLFL